MGGNRRIFRWAVPVAVVGVLAIAVLASLRLAGPEDSPSQSGNPVSTAAAVLGDPAAAATVFLDAWAGRDWETLESVVGSGADVAASQHQAWFDDLDVSSLEIELARTTPGAVRATADFVVSVGVGDAGEWSYSSRLTLLPDGDQWRVEWTPAVLHPSLATGDHLEVVARWPDRAVIADVEERAIVGDEPAVVVGVVPGWVESRAALAGVVQAELGVEPAALDAALDAPGVQPDWFVPIARIDRVTYAQLRPVLHPVPGITFRTESDRESLYEALGAELIGTTGEITAELLEELGPPYTTSSVVGRSGMERSFEASLAGTPTYDIVRRSPESGNLELHSFPGSPGTTLVSGLQLEMQQAAEAIVASAELPTAIVAIDAPSGEIRAAASSPLGGFNEALSGLYAPGSTFKVVVATALLESGLERTDPVACPESVTVSGKVFTNATTLPSMLSFEQAFARSCNTAFIQLGRALLPEQLADVAGRYGFGLDYSVGIPAAGGRFDSSSDLVTVAASMIGQGEVLASPVHMASVAAAAASGEWVVPSVVTGDDSEPVGTFDIAVMADLRAMMRAVVAGGTGSRAAIEGRDVAGKTGTAEVGSGDDASTVAWFIGFDEEVAFAVMVDGGESGGGAAAPVARDFLLRLDEPLPETEGEVVCAASGDDWPTFQGSGSRSGCSDASPVVEPTVAWSTDVGIQAWLNSPIVVGDTVIVGSAGDVRTGPDAGDGVYALALSDGRQRWQFSTANDVNGIAAADDLVVVTGDEGSVWGIDLQTGDERWRVDVGTSVFGHPAVVGDTAVVGDAIGVLRGIGLDGQIRWQVQMDGAIRGGPATDGTLVYAVTDLGEVGAFNSDGFEIWRERIVFRNVGSGLVSAYGSPTIVGDELVATFSTEGGPGSPGVAAFDRYLGTLSWFGSDPDRISESRWANVRSSVAIGPGGLVMAGSLSEGIQVLAPDTGQAEWIATTGITCGRQWASPVVTSSVAILPRPDGAVYAFDAVEGNLLWRLAIPSDASVTSECAGPDGGRIADGPELQASPAIAPDGTIVVASLGSPIVAIRDGS